MPQLRLGEFVALAAMLISLVALSIDSMLPALPIIGDEYGLTDPNDQQHIITSLFLGLGIGQLLYGPLSDAHGRKHPIYWGIALYLVGCLLCLFAPSYSVLLAGRFLQGLGASSARIITLAIIRDRFEGTAMARVMSFVMAVFILVPALAPLLGQSILLLGSWQWIFVALLLFGLVALAWFALRLEESLPAERRTPLRVPALLEGLRFIVRQPLTVGSVLVMGLMFGGFVAYLSSAQQLFVDVYQTGNLFPLYFALLALAIGLASIVNARLVTRLGMVRVCYLALVGQCLLSGLMVAASFWFDREPPLWLFMLYCFPLFFSMGLQFGNLNALALQPLGHIAGLGASVAGCVSTVLAVPVGALVGLQYDGTPMPLIMGFAGFGVLGLLLFHRLCGRSG